MVYYVMHDWPPGATIWETKGCRPAEGEKPFKRMYIQDAIDGLAAKPCSVCMPGTREEKIAYDIFVERRGGGNGRVRA